MIETTSKPHPFDRIKDALQEWASFMKDKKQGGYPSSSAFAVERVQSSSVMDGYYANIPDRVIKLDKAIEAYPPQFKQIMNMEYMQRRPQATKAAALGIKQPVYSSRLAWMYECLSYFMFGEDIAAHNR